MSMTKYVLPSHSNPFHTNLFPSVIFTRIPLHSTANIQVLPLDRREGYGVEGATIGAQGSGEEEEKGR